MAIEGQRAGRPRDDRVDAAIVAATRELLAEVGYAGLTMDAVAARAGVGKGAIYRRHAAKAEMAFAATVYGMDPRTFADTGSLLGDLTALAEAVAGDLGDPAASRAIMSLLGEIGDDTASVAQFLKACVEPEVARHLEILERAADRGELAAPPDAELVHSVVGGTVMAWLLVHHRAPDGLAEKLARFMHAALTGAAPPRESDGV
ncbi:TetR/AcrR family transcriptional regulator [Yinghuangia soli]|uniref:TetR/AcrR family transcriptional regulator n=1 Tax=Yinghuangia soli TaxID=2908204 RepID=A0AA41U8Q2_9ACTN|nr:TetR/AcrR family transcriptional regulator [Yinghuangia soli]MCF2533129.1 TetR/AcrR family transcriptional regulator [Yinghuangia soli]